jgi:succinate dehydrogenase hydrophobic anchor subunit
VITGDRKILWEIFQGWSTVARNRGRDYLICWLHRVTGCLLLFYVLLHINTLSALATPEVFQKKAALFNAPFMVFLEWLLALPVIFHCVNGGRVIIYELFDTRWDPRLSRIVFGTCSGFMVLLGYFMIIGDQQVSAHFYWLNTMLASAFIAYLTIARIRSTRTSMVWKLQRITGSFLFLIVPAHMLFMHLNVQTGKDVAFITARLDQPFIVCVDILLLLSVLFHGGYGVVSICNDYLTSVQVRRSCMLGVIVILTMFALQGIRLIVTA